MSDKLTRYAHEVRMRAVLGIFETATCHESSRIRWPNHGNTSSADGDAMAAITMRTGHSPALSIHAQLVLGVSHGHETDGGARQFGKQAALFPAAPRIEADRFDRSP